MSWLVGSGAIVVSGGTTAFGGGSVTCLFSVVSFSVTSFGCATAATVAATPSPSPSPAGFFPPAELYTDVFPFTSSGDDEGAAVCCVNLRFLFTVSSSSAEFSGDGVSPPFGSGNKSSSLPRPSVTGVPVVVTAATTVAAPVAPTPLSTFNPDCWPTPNSRSGVGRVEFSFEFESWSNSRTTDCTTEVNPSFGVVKDEGE